MHSNPDATIFWYPNIHSTPIVQTLVQAVGPVRAYLYVVRPLSRVLGVPFSAEPTVVPFV
jgi:hypothetical protein